MSFDLKPITNLDIFTDFNTLKWTLSRNEVPIVLEHRGITLAQWQATFDLTEEPYRYVLDNYSGGKVAFYVLPCFLPVTIPMMMDMRGKYEDMWVELAQQQAKVYRPYGIQVTPIKELGPTIHIRGCNEKQKSEFVGLRFTLATADPATHQNHTTPEAIATPIHNRVTIVEDQNLSSKKTNNNTYAVTSQTSQQLDQLQALRQTGALTDQEYEQARTRVLQLEKQ